MLLLLLVHHRRRDAPALGEVVEHGRRLLHPVALVDGQSAGRNTAGSLLGEDLHAYFYRVINGAAGQLCTVSADQLWEHNRNLQVLTKAFPILVTLYLTYTHTTEVRVGRC